MINTLDLAIPREFLVAQSKMVPKVDLKVESKPWSQECQIEANNDLEAVLKWLGEYHYKRNTYKAYRREGLRFLLWCTYQQGKTLGDLKKEDMENYFAFLQDPPQNWCEVEEGNKEWRPFKGALSHSALMTSIRILNSLFNYLVQAEYLRANPIKLIKQYAKLSINTSARQYQVWERILELDEWDAVQEALVAMPEESAFEKENKLRTQFLFALLYFLGLRIHEVENHAWGNFRKKEGQWWFFVKGKGDKLGHVPVNQQLLEYVKAYRGYLKKTPLPQINETEALLVSSRTKQPLKITQLYSMVKAIGERAAEQFEDNPEKQAKLQALSPHWLRHLAASHQDRLGMPVSMIKENLRHQSSQTTELYVHAEDEARFTEIQKMQMRIIPQEAYKGPEVVAVEYRLRLTKGPVDKVKALLRLLGGIEKQVFNGVEWTNVGEDREAIVEKMRDNSLLGNGIEIAYQLSSKTVMESPCVWEEALKRQCESWLFKCSVETVMVEGS